MKLINNTTNNYSKNPPIDSLPKRKVKAGTLINIAGALFFLCDDITVAGNSSIHYTSDNSPGPYYIDDTDYSDLSENL
ncbi:hypothetical protein EHQ13_04615 [Leptospira gomenensis]|uniref:Uncharacterized protein n=1 Tax=Leptospira gomenensis TaxID=2484974 RepID=A0A5F1Z1R0_9LEPT|nr:hypothetical protein EHQ17_19410 [Leptospira gomenensis]TGK42621.1 hypothetical protein EHQ07_14510 [Leptospira gomenensis]TGK65784.1 hypothetical protein EHQ13_04615 [Leptospira gomenensis]